MKIETGLFEHMVLQRDGKVAQRAMVTGGCKGKGTVFARATAGGANVRGWGKRKVGAADGKRFVATLAGLPVGGPYEIELRCGEESVTVKDVLVGDVWILAGQSNMQGYGHMPAKPIGRDPLVRAFHMDDHWEVAVDPIHRVDQAVDPVHEALVGHPIARMEPWHGVGPGVSFGQSMHRRTGIPQGLLACSHGGSFIADWNPKLKKQGGRSLYGATMRRLTKNYPGSAVAGVLWYQGCSEARDPETVKDYREKTIGLFKAFRRDLHAPSLPIVLVQIGNIVTTWDKELHLRWSAVREDERLIGETMARTATVPVVDLELDESIHLSGESQYELGRRLADAMESIRMKGKRGAPVRPIALESVGFRPYEDGRIEIVVTFANVVGKLVSGDRPTGFKVDLPSSDHEEAVTRVRLEGNRAVLLTTVTLNDILRGPSALWYGFGCNPYCNIRDEAGRSLPAFGPWPLNG